MDQLKHIIGIIAIILVFIGLWEKINNINFNGVEFDGFRNKTGHNYFVLTPTKWIASTNAIGIHTKFCSKCSWRRGLE